MKKRLVAIPILIVMFTCFQAPTLSASMDSQQSSNGDNVFNLTECVEIALDRSPQILGSQADIKEKESSLLSSQKDLYPSLFFQYGYQHAPDAYAPFGIENYYNYSFSVKQPIYRGRALVTGVELGELDLEISKSAMTQTQNDIIITVHEAYYNLLKTRKFEEVAEQSLKERKSHLKDAKAYFKAGLIPKNDMLELKLNLSGPKINPSWPHLDSTPSCADRSTAKSSSKIFSSLNQAIFPGKNPSNRLKNTGLS